jgi:hypothetical protein
MRCGCQLKLAVHTAVCSPERRKLLPGREDACGRRFLTAAAALLPIDLRAAELQCGMVADEAAT